MIERTEFYEIAVGAGFYGPDDSSLTGKKDNVRKYWEDISIKLCLRDVLEKLLAKRRKLRVVDLGCGSGEGFELLTHVPARPHGARHERDFLVLPSELETYVGLDLSPGMVAQGRQNHAAYAQVQFAEADLARGFPLSDRPPFDLYFSSYASLSHLSPADLLKLVSQIGRHVDGEAFIVFDLLGQLSPEWPKYWHEKPPAVLPYNMAYLLKAEERAPEKVDWFTNCFWTATELRRLLAEAGRQAERRIEVHTMVDRAVFVGRHIDTGLFNDNPRPLRYQVNRLLDHGYRGLVELLRVDLAHLEAWRDASPEGWARICDYARKWNTVVELLEALMQRRNDVVRRLIEAAEPPLADDLKMLAWVCRNGERFPVADYWASIVGPQVALVLRSLEMSYADAVGCGHALFCVARINKP
jgi:SAM-dependent methyltransferase